MKKIASAELFNIIQVLGEYMYYNKSYTLDMILKKLWEIKKLVDELESEKFSKKEK